MTASIERWDAYKEHVRRFVNGDEDDDIVTVFGVCVRCGSSRLVITNKQLQSWVPLFYWESMPCRADEGMTELRTCRDCGHTSRTNS